MGHSSMVWQDAYEGTMANGHSYYGTPEDFRKRTNAHAAASLYTTAADYARFVCAVLNSEGLEHRTVEEMLTPVIDVDEDYGVSWSLGFGLQTDANGSAFWQWGDYGIFRNYVIAYPKQRIGVVYLTNSFYGLGLCGELVTQSIGGRALGVESLEYLPYDSPVHLFAWAVMDRGAGAVDELLPTMAAQHPDLLSDRAIAIIGTILSDGQRYDEVIAFYDYVIEQKPQSPAIVARLARAHLEKGELDKAKSYYMKVNDMPEVEDFDTETVEWALSYIKALEEPAVLSDDYLESLAGAYETRHIKFEDGVLYYFRENVEAKDYRRLYPLSRDTFIIKEIAYFRLRFELDDTGSPAFIIEEIAYFRLRFDLDETGNPTRIVGMYEWGHEDQSQRSK
jgi:tetratricopeptide (TPR) repeat protein